ncbi:MAG: AAA family ATPase [Candidatus Woesearchaeota archaeon]
MANAIIVTGTPGTGKTTVAMRLAKKLGWKYVDVNKVISKERLSEGYDRKNRCRIVDEKKLGKTLVQLAKKSEENLVIDSHMSHYMPAKSVDLCIVTRCNLKILKRRLKRRGYTENKIKDNLECEIFDTCLIESQEAGHDVIVVETDKKVDYDKILKKVKIKK